MIRKFEFVPKTQLLSLSGGKNEDSFMENFIQIIFKNFFLNSQQFIKKKFIKNLYKIEQI